ncbi:hypothetical protein V1389_17000 [Flavobacterium rakeshii]|uniref:hypothetical protein n=1 Tax=Flavobacterium rakeshii TaxID=1038845 RepID=UPI002E7AF9FC|nr:hypothetical protein [Flavobacterium rakeshii]MEE1900049.1 hypothetical protein [Flavobacterium rakeshii]
MYTAMNNEKLQQFCLAILFTFLLVSCGGSDTEERKIYDDKGNLVGIELYENGIVKEKTGYSYEGNKVLTLKIIDSVNSEIEEYYPNGETRRKGSLYHGMKKGWWLNYNDTGKLISKQEFFIVADSDYQNQVIYYDDQNNIMDKSNYADINFPDYLEIGRQIIKVDYHSPNISDSHVMVCVSDSIKADFSNINEVLLDTFYSGDNKNVWFGIECNDKKERNVRGFILEEHIYTEEIGKEDSINIVIDKTKLFFDKKLSVK